MAQREYSDYQNKIIDRYYDNRDKIDDQRFSELVTSLYLATTEKQKERLWKSAEEVMTRLKVPPTRVQHVITRREPEILAEVVKDIQSGAIKVGGK